MTTLISHVYNEEFLLPFFIEQHYSKFDHGIILDFGSTDNSKSIIEKLAPKWQIIDCSEYLFDAIKLDNLITDLESDIQGICITLTVTEFLIGDPRLVSKEVIIPTVSLLRLPEDPEIRLGQKFHEVYKNGIFPFHPQLHSETEWMARKKGRRISVLRSPYPRGRHFDLLGDSLLLIYRVSNCLANEHMIKRRLQIQNKIPDSDKALGYGVQHTDYGKELTQESLLRAVDNEIKFCVSIGDYIELFLDIEKITLNEPVDSGTFKLFREILTKFEFNQFLLRESELNSKLIYQAEIIEILESKLFLSNNLVVRTNSELEEARRSQNRPSQNLQSFFRNIRPAIKVRINSVFKKHSR
jgi:hypothetical protein